MMRIESSNSPLSWGFSTHIIARYEMSAGVGFAQPTGSAANSYVVCFEKTICPRYDKKNNQYLLYDAYMLFNLAQLHLKFKRSDLKLLFEIVFSCWPSFPTSWQLLRWYSFKIIWCHSPLTNWEIINYKYPITINHSPIYKYQLLNIKDQSSELKKTSYYYDRLFFTISISSSTIHA